MVLRISEIFEVGISKWFLVGRDGGEREGKTGKSEDEEKGRAEEASAVSSCSLF